MDPTGLLLGWFGALIQIRAAAPVAPPREVRGAGGGGRGPCQWHRGTVSTSICCFFLVFLLMRCWKILQSLGGGGALICGLWWEHKGCDVLWAVPLRNQASAIPLGDVFPHTAPRPSCPLPESQGQVEGGLLGCAPPCCRVCLQTKLLLPVPPHASRQAMKPSKTASLKPSCSLTHGASPGDHHSSQPTQLPVTPGWGTGPHTWDCTRASAHLAPRARGRLPHQSQPIAKAPLGPREEVWSVGPSPVP